MADGRRDRDLLDPWLDGVLPHGESRAFDERLERDPELRAEADRQVAIDDSLGRLFAPPATPGDVPALRGGPAPAATVPRPTRWPALAAAAAVLLALAGLWILSRDGGEPGTGNTGNDDGAIARGTASDTGRLQPVPLHPPPAPGVASPEPPRSPSLEALYHLAASGELSVGGPSGPVACTDPSSLAQAIQTRYGQCLQVQHSSTSAFVGPFPARGWPGATFLVAYSGGRPSLIVIAETPCSAPSGLVPSPSGELRMFQKRVGEVTVSEITPAPYARYLASFEVCN